MLKAYYICYHNKLLLYPNTKKNSFYFLMFHNHISNLNIFYFIPDYVCVQKHNYLRIYNYIIWQLGDDQYTLQNQSGKLKTWNTAFQILLAYTPYSLVDPDIQSLVPRVLDYIF